MKFKVAIACICCIIAVDLSHAQQSDKKLDLSLREVSVSEALNKLVKVSNIDLVYNSDVLLSARISLLLENVTSRQALSEIVQAAKLDFIQLSSGTYVIVNPIKKEPKLHEYKGLIVDASTGEPLPSANVSIANSSLGTFTNNSGYFSIPGIKSGFYELVVNYVGYEPFSKKVSVSETEAGNLNRILLQPKSYLAEPLIISGEQPWYFTQKNNTETAVLKKLGFIKNERQNLIRSLEFFSGINTLFSSPDLSIQGNSGNNSLVYLDGVPVYNPFGNSFFSSAFSPYAIDRIIVHKAGSGVTSPSLLSGSVNFTHDLKQFSNNTTMLQSEPAATNFRTEHTFNNDRTPLDVMITGRFSNSGFIESQRVNTYLQNFNQLDPFLQNFFLGDGSELIQFDPLSGEETLDFYDIHAALNINHTSLSDTKISFYHGSNELNTALLSEHNHINTSVKNLLYTEDRSRTDNTTLNLEHTNVLSKRVEMHSKVYVSSGKITQGTIMVNTDGNFQTPTQQNDFFDALRDEVAPLGTVNKNELLETGISSAVRVDLSGNTHLKSGIEAKIYDYELTFDDMFFFPTHNQEQNAIGHIYSELSSRLNSKVELTGGVKLTTSSSTNLIYAEPRFAINFENKNSFAGYNKISLSGGLYRQFINRFDVVNAGPNALLPEFRFWVPADFTANIPKAWQLALNYSFFPDGWKVSIENYAIIVENDLVLNYENLLNPSVTSNTPLIHQSEFTKDLERFSYGTSVSVNRKFDQPDIFLSLMYQYNRSEQKIPGRFNDNFQRTPLSYKHITDVQVKWNLIPQLSLLTNFKWIPQRSWAFKRSYYDFAALHNLNALNNPPLLDPEDDTLPFFLQVNAGVNYLLDISGKQLQLRLDIIDVIDRKNSIDRTLIPVRSENNEIFYRTSERKLPGFSPMMSLEIKF